MMPTNSLPRPRNLRRFKLKYTNSFRDRGGRIRHYFRRNGKSVALPGVPGSTKFMQAYAVAMADDFGQPVDAIDAICQAIHRKKSVAKEVVYFVRIGEHVKIGTSRNLKDRLGSFKNAAVEVRLLFAIPGGRELERRVHEAFSKWKVAREIFRHDVVDAFRARVKAAGVEDALDSMRTDPPMAEPNPWDVLFDQQFSHASRSDEVPQKREEPQCKMLARIKRHEENAYYASLVAGRKQRLGW